MELRSISGVCGTSFLRERKFAVTRSNRDPAAGDTSELVCAGDDAFERNAVFGQMGESRYRSATSPTPKPPYLRCLHGS